MTTNKKILVGLLGAGVLYLLFKDKITKALKIDGGGNANQTPSAPQNTGDSPCPEGQVLTQPNCIKAPCPPICVDRPKAEPKPHKDPLKTSDNSRGTIYTCKDGSTETRYADKIYSGVPACMKKGGYVSYMPIENKPPEGWCPPAYRYDSKLGCVSMCPKGMFC